MRVAVLFSGGKDSTYTVWLLQHQAWEIPVLITVEPQERDSMMFHSPAVKWTTLQARAMGIDHVAVEVPAGVEEGLEELGGSLFSLGKDFHLDGVATGAVASDYQKSRFDRVCGRAGLESYSPLWHKHPSTIVADIVQADFKVMLTAVAAKGLDESWMGRTLDKTAWEELGRVASRHGIHLTGEGGEYESFVTDGPNFHKAVRIEKTRRIWDGQSGQLIIESASLGDKPGD